MSTDMQTTNIPDASFAAMDQRYDEHTAQIYAANERHRGCCWSLADVAEHDQRDAAEINALICTACNGCGMVVCPSCSGFDHCHECHDTTEVPCEACHGRDADHAEAIDIKAGVEQKIAERKAWRGPVTYARLEADHADAEIESAARRIVALTSSDGLRCNDCRELVGNAHALGCPEDVEV